MKKIRITGASPVDWYIGNIGEIMYMTSEDSECYFVASSPNAPNCRVHKIDAELVVDPIGSENEKKVNLYNDLPEKALRYNQGKPKWSLIHYKSLEPMIRVLEAGAKKYAPFNWQKPMDKKEILESMQRHLAALMDGEEIDPETGYSHVGNIQCNAMFYNYHNNKNNQSNT